MRLSALQGWSVLPFCFPDLDFDRVWSRCGSARSKVGAFCHFVSQIWNATVYGAGAARGPVCPAEGQCPLRSIEENLCQGLLCVMNVPGMCCRHVRQVHSWHRQVLDNRVSALARCWVAFVRASVRDVGTVFVFVAVVVACVYCRGPVPASVD